jgi:hypothetical protein
VSLRNRLSLPVEAISSPYLGIVSPKTARNDTSDGLCKNRGCNMLTLVFSTRGPQIGEFHKWFLKDLHDWFIAGIRVRDHDLFYATIGNP